MISLVNLLVGRLFIQ